MYGNNFGYPFIGGMPNQIVPPMTGNMMGPMIGAPLRSGGGGLRSLLGLGRMSTGTSGFTIPDESDRITPAPHFQIRY